LKKKNGKEKVASKKLEKSKKDLSMKNQDILSNGKLIKKEKLIEFNVLKNLADWRLNLSLGLEEKNRLSMNSNSMLKDLFKYLEFQTNKSMSNPTKVEIDSFKLEELRCLDLMSENMKEDCKLKTVRVNLKDNANLSSGELKKNKSSKE
jgi:hypothetical protein